MAQYEYTPLDPETKTTRLMRLLPGSFDDEIHVSLRIMSLPGDEPASYDMIPYNALSYTWGSTDDPVTIWVGDFPARSDRAEGCITISQNLAVALKHLRSPFEPCDIWIDAICINQQDLNERSSQVGKMGDIYSNADQVIVWLGPQSSDSELAIDTLEMLGTRIEVDWETRIIRGADSSDRDDTSSPNWHKDLNFNDKTWYSFLNLMQRSWFQRLWIWQEVLLAQEAKLQCGHQTLDWNDFRKAILALASQERPKFPSVDASLESEYCRLIIHIGQLIVCKALDDSLTGWIQYTENCQCSDPRDRLYAIKNIVYPGEFPIAFHPDYTKATYKIFQDLVLCRLDEKEDLDILSSCNSSMEKSERPSWVPDWSKPSLFKNAFTARACWGTKSSAQYVGNGLLKVTLVRAAEISSTEEYNNSLIGENRRLLATRLIHRLLGHVRQALPSATFDDMLDILCRTILKNDVAEAYIPVSTPHPNLKLCQDFMKHLVHATPLSTQFPHQWPGQLAEYTRGRQFFVCKEGNTGLAPQAAREGDQVCVILGCQSPLVLRQHEDGYFTIIGDCYIDGLMTAEAVLGPLPYGWEGVAILPEGSGLGYMHGFVNRHGGVQSFEDPRLGQLPDGWRLETAGQPANWHNWFINITTGEELVWPRDPRMSKEALATRGVHLEEVILK
ncbi:MAG: hypothetical protein Q9168_002975 [Polycauliona sp. 1 TL-2023]